MSLIEYHKDTTRQLLSLEKNVRNLVEHWPEDGRYKEAVLKSMIRRFLPEKYIIATGFVISPTEIRGQHEASRQIDLMIYENSSPVVFKEGDFVILTPECVRGIIEVKANLLNQDVAEVVQRANENGRFIFQAARDPDELFFNGIFSYNGGNVNPRRLEDLVTAGNSGFLNDPAFPQYKVNHIALKQNRFLKYWPGEDLPHSLYRLEELAFAFFIANLLATLANGSIEPNNFIWFAEDKERGLIHRF